MSDQYQLGYTALQQRAQFEPSICVHACPPVTRSISEGKEEARWFGWCDTSRPTSYSPPPGGNHGTLNRTYCAKSVDGNSPSNPNSQNETRLSAELGHWMNITTCQHNKWHHNSSAILDPDSTLPRAGEVGVNLETFLIRQFIAAEAPHPHKSRIFNNLSSS